MALVISANRIEYEEGGEVLAEVDFPASGAGAVEICHTWVDGSMRGRGLAGLLLERTAEELRQTGRKAVPTCSYAVDWFNKHPEYRDLLPR
jgi:predicted GNAT family acetyltransferase